MLNAALRRKPSRVTLFAAPVALAAMTVLAPGRSVARTAGHGHTAPIVEPSLELTQPIATSELPQSTFEIPDAWYSEHEALKTDWGNGYGLTWSLPVSIFWQSGTPHSGQGSTELVYAPSITWRAFSDTALGSGAFDFAFAQNQFWTRANTTTQQANMGLLVPPNSWGTNSVQFEQLTYTHTRCQATLSALRSANIRSVCSISIKLQAALTQAS
jgi:hypothetical protein